MSIRAMRWICCGTLALLLTLMMGCSTLNRAIEKIPESVQKGVEEGVKKGINEGIPKVAEEVELRLIEKLAPILGEKVRPLVEKLKAENEELKASLDEVYGKVTSLREEAEKRGEEAADEGDIAEMAKQKALSEMYGLLEEILKMLGIGGGAGGLAYFIGKRRERKLQNGSSGKS